MAWATTDDVEDVTGETVTAPQLAQAQAVVELFTGRTPASDDALLVRDVYWLKQAVCWQTVWQKEQPGFASRSSVANMIQDGAHWEYTSKAAVNLAPLAIRAIKNLSWMGSRTVSFAVPLEAVGQTLLESSDPVWSWQPL